MKYIQSFYPYAVTFSSVEKTVPQAANDTEDSENGIVKNILCIEDELYDKMQKAEPLFRHLIDQKKYRLLDKLPVSYKPAATLVNEANARADALQKENDALKASAKNTQEKNQTAQNDDSSSTDASTDADDKEKSSAKGKNK